MKKGFFVLLAALLLAGCTAQATDETTTEPKPEERLLLQTVTAVYEDRTVRSEYIYDGADVLKAVITYQDDAESYRTYTTCDEAGNVIKRSIVFVGSGQTAAQVEHTYDTHGRLLESTTTVAGVLTVTEKRTYRGGLLELLRREDHARGTVERHMYTYQDGVPVSSTCSDGSGRRLSTTVYSCEGTVTTAVTTDASGAETGRVVTTRDEMGNVLRQEHSGEDPVTYTYTYRRTEGPAA
jgi:hypothetical protein